MEPRKVIQSIFILCCLSAVIDGSRISFGHNHHSGCHRHLKTCDDLDEWLQCMTKFSQESGDLDLVQNLIRHHPDLQHCLPNVISIQTSISQDLYRELMMCESSIEKISPECDALRDVSRCILSRKDTMPDKMEEDLKKELQRVIELLNPNCEIELDDLESDNLKEASERVNFGFVIGIVALACASLAVLVCAVALINRRFAARKQSRRSRPENHAASANEVSANDTGKPAVYQIPAYPQAPPAYCAEPPAYEELEQSQNQSGQQAK